MEQIFYADIGDLLTYPLEVYKLQDGQYIGIAAYITEPLENPKEWVCRTLKSINQTLVSEGFELEIDIQTDKLGINETTIMAHTI